MNRVSSFAIVVLALIATTGAKGQIDAHTHDHPNELQSEIAPTYALDGETPDEALRLTATLSALEPILDFDAAAMRLAEAIRIPTVSSQSGAIDSATFRALHHHIERSFPAVYRTLHRERVGGLSLLYTWAGTDSTLDPILLMAHQDVVPVDSGSVADWQYPPFAGKVSNGYVWGRGAIDDKHCMMAILEAVELLIRSGFAPTRTIYLAFGHDEEVGGANGAAQIAALFAERGERLFMVLDEGGFIVNRFMPRIRGAVAAIGVAEKGSVSLELSVRTEGGHSSVPGETAFSILSYATSRLQERPFPARLHEVPVQTLKHLARVMPMPERVVLSNLWLFKPLVLRKLGRSPETQWMLRTTTAITMFSAGTKSNVLPAHATAVVNFRTMPGETLNDVTQTVREIIRDARIQIRPVGAQREAPKGSAPSGDAYDALVRTIGEVTGGEKVTIVPFLVPGGTDARYFAPISDAVYRFAAVRMSRNDLRRFHATDERIAVREYGRSIKFYNRLLSNVSGQATVPMVAEGS